MRPGLIHKDQDRLDKPSQSWGGEGGGGDSKLGRLQSESGTDSRQPPRRWGTSSGASLFCPEDTWRRAAEDEPDLHPEAEQEVKLKQRQAWGLYRLCHHGNQTLEVDSRTTEGGQRPLTASVILCCCCPLWRERYLNPAFTHQHLTTSNCCFSCQKVGFYTCLYIKESKKTFQGGAILHLSIIKDLWRKNSVN